MHTSDLVELIDIFPTLTELAGLDKKPLVCVEGTSVTPLLSNPDQQWKKAAFSQYPRPAEGMTQIPNEPPYNKGEHSENVMRYSIRVD